MNSFVLSCDLNRIESRLEKAQGSSSAKDYQGLSLFCAGAFIGLATFTISLYLNAIAPPPALAFITSVATVLSLILTIIFWQISRKFGVIKADLIGEVMEEIKHHKAKFLR
ncbi:MAG: hypothetical protein IPK98_14375 [Chloracidobacterium sp.]|nr:hypothetical protein [Chloracidobacterium sp.]